MTQAKHTLSHRRGFLQGVACAPLALAAPALAGEQAEPDPIFAKIQALREQIVSDDDYDAFVEAWEALEETRPTTPAGALSLVLFMREIQQELGEWCIDDGVCKALDIAANAAAAILARDA